MQEFGIIRLPRVRNVRPDGSKGRFCGRTAFDSSGFRETGNGRPKRGAEKGKGRRSNHGKKHEGRENLAVPRQKRSTGKNPKNKRPPANLSQAAAKSVRLLDFLQLVAEDLADLKPFRFLRNLVFRFFGLFLRLPDAQGDPFVFFIHFQYFYFHLVPFA